MKSRIKSLLLFSVSIRLITKRAYCTENQTFEESIGPAVSSDFCSSVLSRSDLLSLFSIFSLFFVAITIYEVVVLQPVGFDVRPSEITCSL
jgi:hypothetical protein